MLDHHRSLLDLSTKGTFIGLALELSKKLL